MGKQFDWLFGSRVRSFAAASKTLLQQSPWLMLFLLGWAPAAPAVTVDVTGTWTATMSGTIFKGGSGEGQTTWLTLDLVQSGSSVSGTSSFSDTLGRSGGGHVNGSISGNTMTFSNIDPDPACAPRTITATATVTNTAPGSQMIVTFTAPASSDICPAFSASLIYTKAGTTSYALAVSNVGSGTVTSKPAGIDCGATCSARFSSGAVVTLTATPASGSFFAGWRGACSGIDSCVLTMNAAKIVAAAFKLKPFIANTAASITPTSATVTTTIDFNAADVGKRGSVFITGWVPVSGLGALGIQTAALSKAMSVTTTSDNPYLAGKVNSRQVTLGALLAAGPDTWVLVQKTPSGWALVVNGQLIPFATGVLGELMAAQSLLNNTDPSNLPGAQFCVGYGTSDTEMIVSGRMLPVAIIPVANQTSTTSGSCNVTDIVVVEFYKADINHYFMTASTDEAASLDNNASWNWVRTAKAFNVWLTQASAPGNASPVCRFYGVFANGTVGSHFYTVDPDECEYVKSRLDWGWGYEGDAFYAVKPTGGSCPSGTSPVYRAYNNGMGGAPNHRYMTSQAEVDTMVSQGWVSEGTAFCGAQ